LSSPQDYFLLEQCLQRLALRGVEIIDLVLAVEREQPELQASLPSVVDDPKPDALALPLSGIREAHLPQPPGALDDVARFGLGHERRLQRRERRIIEVLRSIALERRQFDERSSHGMSLYAIRVRTQVT
jgi:hypothetical protein